MSCGSDRGADVPALDEAHAADVHLDVARRLADALAADGTAETFRIALHEADAILR